MIIWFISFKDLPKHLQHWIIVLKLLLKDLFFLPNQLLVNFWYKKFQVVLLDFWWNLSVYLVQNFHEDVKIHCERNEEMKQNIDFLFFWLYWNILMHVPKEFGDLNHHELIKMVVLCSQIFDEIHQVLIQTNDLSWFYIKLKLSQRTW